jgi:hypothetical protein
VRALPGVLLLQVYEVDVRLQVAPVGEEAQDVAAPVLLRALRSHVFEGGPASVADDPVAGVHLPHVAKEVRLVLEHLPTPAGTCEGSST